MKTASMSGSVGDGTCGGADEKPLGGAADPAPGAAAASDAEGVVTFASKRGGFLAFVGEVSLGGGEFWWQGAGRILRRRWEIPRARR